MSSFLLIPNVLILLQTYCDLERKLSRGRSGRVRRVVGFPLPIQSAPITTYVVSSNLGQGKFVSDLGQVGGFQLVLRFPPSIKLKYY